MTTEERLENARKVLGLDVIRHPRKTRKARPRKVETMVKTRCGDGVRKKMWSSCSRKRRYATRGDATRKASFCETRRGVRLRPYLCPYCGGWHLTHVRA